MATDESATDRSGKTEDEGKAQNASERPLGPDPVTGAGITLFGIFVMGIGGATNSHAVFDIGMFVAVAGAVLFVLFVALSAIKQKPQTKST